VCFAACLRTQLSALPCLLIRTSPSGWGEVPSGQTPREIEGMPEKGKGSNT
jgi:hypothetical protein